MAANILQMFGLRPKEAPVGGRKQSVMRQLSAMEEDVVRKRRRGEGDSCAGGSRTPTLVNSRRRVLGETSGAVAANNEQVDDNKERPVKRFRGETKVVDVEATKEKKSNPQLQSSLLSSIPEDVVSHCLSFLCSVEDRFALQTTCKQFRRLSNSDEILSKIQVGGDRETGKNGIIREDDTPEKAAVALSPFVAAGNQEAIYMSGIIKSYCHQDVARGIKMLKTASSSGYVRASYALGLVLRDSQPDEATKYMKQAAGEGYLPALQELLPAREMKAKFGEPNADELRRHLDPICLNRLLGRHYVHSAELRELNTSHCWNPLCGRWAFKASVAMSAPSVRLRRPWGFSLYRNGEAQNNDSSLTDAGPRAGSAHTDTRVDSSGTSDVSFSSQPGNQTAAATPGDFRVSRMKMCSRCCRAKYCSKLCQVYDWRSGRHKMECQFL